MYFLSKATKFCQGEQKIRFANSLMKNSGNKQLRQWATVQERLYLIHGWLTWEDHRDKSLEAYKTQDPKVKAMIDLHQIAQKEHEMVNEYNVHFNTLMAEALITNPDFDSNMLQQYFRGLKKTLVDQLLPYMAMNAPLSMWQASAFELNNYMQMIKQLRFCTGPVTHSGNTSTTHQQA